MFVVFKLSSICYLVERREDKHPLPFSQVLKNPCQDLEFCRGKKVDLESLTTPMPYEAILTPFRPS